MNQVSTPSKPRIAIAIPSGDMVHADFAANLAALCLNPGAEAGIVNCKGSLVAVNRNQCVAAALLIKATHILFLDSDMTFPLDVLKRLLAHDRDIVGALYAKRTPPFHSLGIPWEGVDSLGLRRMRILPTGCVMLRMSVFDALPKPYFNTRTEGEKIVGEDVFFCEAATKAGFSIWEDIELSKNIGHIGQKTYSLSDKA